MWIALVCMSIGADVSVVEVQVLYIVIESHQDSILVGGCFFFKQKTAYEI